MYRILHQVKNRNDLVREKSDMEYSIAEYNESISNDFLAAFLAIIDPKVHRVFSNCSITPVVLSNEKTINHVTAYTNSNNVIESITLHNYETMYHMTLRELVLCETPEVIKEVYHSLADLSAKLAGFVDAKFLSFEEYHPLRRPRDAKFSGYFEFLSSLGGGFEFLHEKVLSIHGPVFHPKFVDEQLRQFNVGGPL